MEKSESINDLATALAKAQSQMHPAAKDSTNPHFKSRYADLASIWEACRTALTANGISVVQSPSADGTKVLVTTMLIHASGQYLRGELSMTAQQATPHAVGSCITYARRYALAAMVGVAPDDDDGSAATARPALPAGYDPNDPHKRAWLESEIAKRKLPPLQAHAVADRMVGKHSSHLDAVVDGVVNG